MISTITPQGVLMGDGTNITLVEARGFGSAEVELSTYRRGGRHGIVINRALWRARRPRLTFKLRASTIAAFAELKDQFIQAWNLPQAGDTVTIPLTTIDGRALQFEAQLAAGLDDVFLPGHVTTSPPITIELLATVLLESQSLETATVYLPISSGVPLPHALPVGFARSGGSVTVANTGNSTVFPTLRIVGPVTNPHVRHAGLGVDFGLDYTIPSGSYVDIDMDEETVLLNSTGSLLNDMTGDFFHLTKGNNTIQFSADSYDAAAYVQVTWRAGYTGI